MLDRLPEYIEPLSFADKRGEVKGKIALSKLTRLSEILADNSGEVTAELFFYRDGKLAVVEGRVNTNLHIICQNCLQPMEWVVDRSVKLGIVSSLEQADRLPEDIDPLLMSDSKILLNDIIEDELLLAIPDFPKHEWQCYSQPVNSDIQSDSSENKQLDSNNPFSILAKLK